MPKRSRSPGTAGAFSGAALCLLPAQPGPARRLCCSRHSRGRPAAPSQTCRPTRVGRRQTSSLAGGAVEGHSGWAPVFLGRRSLGVYCRSIVVWLPEGGLAKGNVGFGENFRGPVNI